jgi:hypothetical protein
MKFPLFAMALCAGFALAAPTNVTQDEIHSNARADGTLIAMAQVCKVSDAEIRTLANKQETATLALAKASAVSLDSATYREYVMGGMQSAYDILAMMPRSGPSYDDNCREIREKITKKISN